MKKIGLTIGKFAPLHKGHEYLLETALAEMDEVYVIIYETDIINIPLEKRGEWIKAKYPSVHLLYAYSPPMQYGLDRKSVKIQMEYMKEILGNIKPTHFYSSEEYGKKAADYLNIIDRRVDNNREVVHISAGKIRENLEQYKDYLDDMVYTDMISKMFSV